MVLNQADNETISALIWTSLKRGAPPDMPFYFISFQSIYRNRDIFKIEPGTSLFLLQKPWQVDED